MSAKQVGELAVKYKDPCEEAKMENLSVLVKCQVKKFGPVSVEGYGPGGRLVVEVRYDDECGNGYNRFSVTGKIDTTASRRRDELETGGMLHEEISKYFPLLAPLVKWHLCSSDGPLHYLASTVYSAGDKDPDKRGAGEPNGWSRGVRFDAVPVTWRISEAFSTFLQERLGTGDFRVVPVAHGPCPLGHEYTPQYTLGGFDVAWAYCPFKDKTEADEFCAALNSCETAFVTVPTSWSKGKVRELDEARTTALWPDATDGELTAPDLEQRLRDRLPAILTEFRAAVESLGFVY